jgi:hypothetical protein
MKRLDINLPQDGIALFERLLKTTPGTLRDYEMTDVSQYRQGGRLIVGFRRYSFMYENKEDKDKLLEVFSKVSENIGQLFEGVEYNVGVIKVKGKENV